MAATFPGGVKSFTTKVADDDILAAHVNDLQDEVVAVETELRKTATGTSVVDHGAMAGLGDDDHAQYLNNTRGDARYVQIAALGTWQTWTPESVVGWSTIASQIYRYCLIGKICYFAVWVTGTSNNTAVTIPLPHTSKSISTYFYWNGSAVGQDNGTNLTAPARWGIQSNTAVLTVWKDWAAGAWTNSGTKQVYAIGFYEVE